MLRVDIWYVMGDKVASTMKQPLLGYRISVFKFKMWIPIYQKSKHCRHSNLPFLVMDSIKGIQNRGLDWKRFIFKDEPVHRWQAENNGEIITTYYNSPEDFKLKHAEYFL